MFTDEQMTGIELALSALWPSAHPADPGAEADRLLAVMDELASEGNTEEWVALWAASCCR